MGRGLPSQQKGSPFSVRSVLPGALPASASIEAKIREYRIKKAWKDALGEALSKRVSPTRLIGTTLYCSVASSAWLSEMNYQKTLIASKINESVGEEAVREIVLKIGKVSQYGPVKAAKTAAPKRELTEEERGFIDKTVGGLKDESIKEVIKRAMEKAKGGG